MGIDLKAYLVAAEHAEQQIAALRTRGAARDLQIDTDEIHHGS